MEVLQCTALMTVLIAAGERGVPGAAVAAAGRVPPPLRQRCPPAAPARRVRRAPGDPFGVIIQS